MYKDVWTGGQKVRLPDERQQPQSRSCVSGWTLYIHLDINFNLKSICMYIAVLPVTFSHVEISNLSDQQYMNESDLIPNLPAISGLDGNSLSRGSSPKVTCWNLILLYAAPNYRLPVLLYPIRLISHRSYKIWPHSCTHASGTQKILLSEKSGASLMSGLPQLVFLDTRLQADKTGISATRVELEYAGAKSDSDFTRDFRMWDWDYCHQKRVTRCSFRDGRWFQILVRRSDEYNNHFSFNADYYWTGFIRTLQTMPFKMPLLW